MFRNICPYSSTTQDGRKKFYIAKTVTYQFGISVFTSKYSKTERRSSAHMVSMLTKKKNIYIFTFGISHVMVQIKSNNSEVLPLKTRASSTNGECIEIPGQASKCSQSLTEIICQEPTQRCNLCSTHCNIWLASLPSHKARARALAQDFWNFWGQILCSKLIHFPITQQSSWRRDEVRKA